MATPSTPNHPGLLDAYRPSYEEVEQYSRLIMQHEHRPSSAMSDCLHEAELHLWALRSLRASRIYGRRLADCVGGA
jgi:hypothetical protein